MAIKHIDPDDTYIVREMFGCGHGHCMPPGFTHWEAGEACIYGHSAPGPTDNQSRHLYWRLVAVPIVDSKGNDMWKKLCDNPNKFGQFPMAPHGAKEDERIGTKIKLHRGEKLDARVKLKYKLVKPTIIYTEPPPRADSDAA